MSYLAIIIIRVYQKTISHFLQGSCRHFPTCSHYSIEAFRVHGFFTGLYLTSKRVLKCNPFFECGFDPVPEKNSCAPDYKQSVQTEKILRKDKLING